MRPSSIIPPPSKHSSVLVGIGQQQKGSWLLRAGRDCSLGRAGGKLLRLNDPRGRQPCCTLTNTGRSLLIQKRDPAVELSVGPARVDRAELPLDGRFRLAGQLVYFRQVRNDDGNELLPGMVGRADSIRRLAKMVRQVAQFEVPALVLGESGTGKELVARALHVIGPRARMPFVVVNAAELSSSLGRSALFGHVRGAYTGADRARQGAFRQADGGTLFLDEIAELTPELQAHLLRVVEQGCAVAVGGDKRHRVDVRLVAATCKPLHELVEAGRFRLDLYQRLAVHTLRVPPLRQRRCDVPLIAQRLMDQAPWLGYHLTANALDSLAHHEFRGNVRELRNLLAQAVLFSDEHHVINAEAIERAVAEVAPLRARRSVDLLQFLQRSGGNVSVAARLAGMPRSTFRDRLDKARRRHLPYQAIATSSAPSAMLAA